MYSRRSVIAAGVSASVLPTSPLLAQGGGENIERLINQWVEANRGEGYFDPEEVSGPQRGTLILAPTDQRVRDAAEFLSRVPKDTTPLQAAKWMIANRNLGNTMEWPPDTPSERRPANPIIIAFFAATQTRPFQGDQTHWCAAFANWMLRNRGLQITNSAGSASFRTYGTATENPQSGDIACFVNTSDARFGHVGFFDSWVAGGQDAMMLCGGNQKNRLGIDRFARTGGGLALHSFRTAPGLRA